MIGGIGASPMKRVTELEDENRRLRKMYIDQIAHALGAKAALFTTAAGKHSDSLTLDADEALLS